MKTIKMSKTQNYLYKLKIEQVKDSIYNAITSVIHNEIEHSIDFQFDIKNKDHVRIINHYTAMEIFALVLAYKLHANQLDKGGSPYIKHVYSVGNSFFNSQYNNEFERMYLAVTGFLHDTIEDTNMTLLELNKLFPEEICSAIDALTFKKEEEDRKKYQYRIAKNDLARKVKIQDLISNLDIKRLNKLYPSNKDCVRITRYATMLHYLIFINEKQMKTKKDTTITIKKVMNNCL